MGRGGENVFRNLSRPRWGRRSRGALGRLKVMGPVRAVAKRLAARMAAAAQRDRRLGGVASKRMAFGIDHGHRPCDHQRTMIAKTNRYLAHASNSCTANGPKAVYSRNSARKVAARQLVKDY